jgi:hypothetical protein
VMLARTRKSPRAQAVFSRREDFQFSSRADKFSADRINSSDVEHG